MITNIKIDTSYKVYFIILSFKSNPIVLIFKLLLVFCQKYMYQKQKVDTMQ